jgi:glycine betaine/proline transport system permease protein
VATAAVTLDAGTSAAARRRWTTVAAVTSAVLLAGAVLGTEVPRWLDIGIQEWAKDVYRWTVEHSNSHWLFTGIFRPIGDGIDWAVDAVLWVLRNLRWPGVIAAAAAVGWRTGGGRAALGGALALAGVGVLGVWDEMLLTLSLMLVAVTIAFAIGVPLGVWTARSDRADRWLRGVLDTAQVMPTFVYLIPVVVLFGIQNPPSVVATVVYAVPPAVRLTNLGLRGVPVVANEVGQSFGCTRRQQLLKVQLPMARRTILLGLNQVIMMAFGIVVIASLVGSAGLGGLVLKGLQKSDVGAAFGPGLAIVLVAVALDRITTGERQRRRATHRFLPGSWDGRRGALAAAGGVAVVVVAARLLGSRSFPDAWTFGIADPVNDVVGWIDDHVRRGVPLVGGTESVNDMLITDVLEPLRRFLTWVPWLTVVGVVGVVGWVSKGWRLGVTCAACMVAIGMMGTIPVGAGDELPMWDLAMDTLSQVLVAIVIAVVISLPLGVLAGRSDRVNALLRPALDTAQVMPQFVYLIPVVALFGAGRACGVVAAVVYAIPPGIRLTSLGMREVPIAPREAAVSFGATPRQELVKVQLPMAFRSILLGINQIVLMVLATVIIAALVGAGALGLESYRGFTKPLSDIGRGLAGGVSIVLLAVVLDRITQAWGTRSSR